MSNENDILVRDYAELLDRHDVLAVMLSRIVSANVAKALGIDAEDLIPWSQD